MLIRILRGALAFFRGRRVGEGEEQWPLQESRHRVSGFLESVRVLGFRVLELTDLKKKEGKVLSCSQRQREASTCWRALASSCRRAPSDKFCLDEFDQVHHRSSTWAGIMESRSRFDRRERLHKETGNRLPEGMRSSIAGWAGETFDKVRGLRMKAKFKVHPSHCSFW